MGMDPIEVEDFLDEKGLVELNPELIIDYMKDPRYVNKLKMGQPQRQKSNVEAPRFDYFNPVNPNKRANPNNMMLTKGVSYNRQQTHGVIKPKSISLSPDLSIDIIEEDNEKCKICYNKKINTVMLPCGHRC